MPSEISEILDGYRTALDSSRERYEDMYEERFENAADFYKTFFQDLIKEYSFDDPGSRRLIKSSVEEIFGGDDVRFGAIDGTSFKMELEDYMVFFAASYAVRGEIHFQGDPPTFEYDRWSTDQDVSMVAYIPVPFAELGDLADEQHQFVSSDDDKIDLSFIHNRLMQLAEVYLAYDLVKGSSLRPKYLLWDHSMSSIYNSNSVEYDKIDLVGYEFAGRELRPQDVILAFSHPYNSELNIPSGKRYKVYEYVLRDLQENGSKKLTEYAKETGIPEPELVGPEGGRLKSYLLSEIDGYDPLVEFNEKTKELSFNRSYRGTWGFLVRLFEDFSERLFKKKDPEALIYEVEEAGDSKRRWMSTQDIEFLIAIGIRALIEECWEHNVFLTGIVKDSSSQYLSKNYLGVSRHEGVYDFNDTTLPWTDRTFLEVLPLVDEDLDVPWSTIEFDSVFMTLNLDEEGGSRRVRGVRGDIVTPPTGLFNRSLGQFYLDLSKRTPNFGHVIFIDRLRNPSFETKPEDRDDTTIQNDVIGEVKPVIYKNREIANKPQDVNMYLLDILTRNLYPNVIGYPDPLHKADWGAKSLNKRVKPMIENSDVSLKANPTRRKLRDLREGW